MTDLIVPRCTSLLCRSFFFFNDTATTEIYTLSLHDALPISMTNSSQPPMRNASRTVCPAQKAGFSVNAKPTFAPAHSALDRKSTRLNSSHGYISYAVFCLKKKKIHDQPPLMTDDSLTLHLL